MDKSDWLYDLFVEEALPALDRHSMGSGGSDDPITAQSKTVTPTKSQQNVYPDSGYDYLSRVVVNGIPDKYIDTSDATATENDISEGKTAYVDGVKKTGTCTYDADTSDATATENDILSGKTAYVDGVKKTGSMKNNGAVSGTISTKAGAYTIPAGYHNGSGKVAISSTEQAKVIASNIKRGVSILGIAGSLPNSLVFYNKTVATSAFKSDTTYPDYPYRAAVVCSGVTTAYTPYVMFSEEDAALGILSRNANSYSGGIYIYASEIPESAISITEIICIEE